MLLVSFFVSLGLYTWGISDAMCRTSQWSVKGKTGSPKSILARPDTAEKNKLLYDFMEEKEIEKTWIDLKQVKIYLKWHSVA